MPVTFCGVLVILDAAPTMPPPTTLEFPGRRPITYESAIDREGNVINELAYVPALKKLCTDLWHQRSTIEAIARHHLGLGAQDTCRISSPDEWIHGGFNVCVWVNVTPGKRRTWWWRGGGDGSSGISQRLVFRCPMPHKLAEARHPGTINEKVGCEVAAHVWMEELCPEVRVPHLFGFGFSDGRQVSPLPQVCA